MTPEQTIRTSKFLSLVLRHDPAAAGVQLDDAGWADVEALLQGCSKVNRCLSLEELRLIVETNPKKRFEFSPDEKRIRASQGHSVEVDLQYEAKTPPAVLYHGTYEKAVETIRETGLQKMARHHVHLSSNIQTTMEVGARRGRPVLLTIAALPMHERGHVFFESTNGVWLVDHVPAEFIQFPEKQ